FAFLLLDQPRDRPGIAFAAQVQRRLVEPDFVDEQSLREELEDAVVEAEILDGHDFAAVQRDGNAFHLDTEEQVPAEPLNRDLAVQEPVRFPYDVPAKPVL